MSTQTDRRAQSSGWLADTFTRAATPREVARRSSRSREISAVAALSGRTGVEALAKQETLSPDQVVLAREVSRRTRGVLWSLVIGHAGGVTAVGQLVWLATDTGWVGLRPHPAHGRRLVDSVLDGGAGLTTLAAGFAERSVALRVAASSYQAADEASAKLLDGVRWTAGFTLPLTAAAALPLLPVLAAAGAPVLEPYLTPGGFDYQRLITNHPGLVDNVVGAGPGLLSLVPGLTVSDVPGAAHLLGNLYPDGTAEVSDGGTDTSVTMKDPPRNFTDLVAGLDYRTTVTFDSQQGMIGDNHGTRSAYLPAATSLDHSTDPSVAAYRDSAGAFLTSDTGSHVQSNIYDMTRTP
ncbi:MAG: hypothetical protein QOE51_142 [Actinoplanes sp.]|nr:hypothetical protein [Actinoplanes sp.]